MIIEQKKTQYKLPKTFSKFCFRNIQLWCLPHIFDLNICNSSVKFNKKSNWFYTGTKLHAFHSKIEGQVILGKTCLRFDPFDMVLIGIFSKCFLKYSCSSFTYVVLLTYLSEAKVFVTVFSCFYKHWVWLHRIGLSLFEFLTTERDWKLVLALSFSKKMFFKRSWDIFDHKTLFRNIILLFTSQPLHIFAC